MCVANSARSQMAEALARKIWGESVWIESAGSAPSQVNPFAVRAIEEIGVDIRRAKSKSVADLPVDFLRDLNCVITLCAEEVCPAFLHTQAERLHWPFPDPAGASGSDAEKLGAFRQVRDQIRARIEGFRPGH